MGGTVQDPLSGDYLPAMKYEEAGMLAAAPSHREYHYGVLQHSGQLRLTKNIIILREQDFH